MNPSNRSTTGKTRLFPHIGQRIGKTAIAVFLCLLLYRLLGYEGSTMRTEAAITAIICMQPFVQSSGQYAISRLTGTFLGIFWGIVFLLLFYAIPGMANRPVMLSALMALGILLSLYSAVVVRKPGASSLAAIVFLCIVISFPDIESPVLGMVRRVADVVIGTVVAIGVNVFHLPRVRHPEYLFFVRTADLLADRFAQIDPAVMFRLNLLHTQGAKICLISDHAPAFFASQMSATKLDIPLIVMDGAAIFDINSNRYLYTKMLPEPSSAWLMRELDALGIGYFIYTVHDNKTCIFHHGEVSPQENVIFQSMKRSPYRSYLEGEAYVPAEIIYLKIIAPEEDLQQVIYRVYPVLAEHGIRAAVRDQAGDLDVAGLYFYAADADLAHAEEVLAATYRVEEPNLKPVEVFSRTGYRMEHDALLVMNKVEALFEPSVFRELYRKWWNKGS